MDHAPLPDSTQDSIDRFTPEEAAAWDSPRVRQGRALRAAEARRLSGRCRNVDPTTCERDYSEAELEFLDAIQAYKRSSGRMFPTWSEVLEILEGLGYQKAE